MSLYFNAASFLNNPNDWGGSLKSKIYNDKTLKSAPAQVYALVSETLKWNLELKEVIEKSELLSERKVQTSSRF